MAIKISAIAIRQTALEKMEHAIGFDFKRVKRNKYTAYRNYYAAQDVMTMIGSIWYL